MGSKLVINRQKSSETVRSAGTNYGATIVDKTGTRLGADAGQAAGVLVAAAVADLSARTDAMVAADDSYLNEISDDSQNVAARDETAAAVRSVLIDLREVSTTVYGPEFVRSLGFDGRTPNDPVQLVRLAEQVITNLDKPAPESTRFGLTIDLNQFKERLAPALTALSDALKAVSGDTRRSDVALVEKRNTMAAYDESFAATANLISTLLKLAGEDELSSRVRPSTRKPGQTIEDAADDPEIPEAVSEQTAVDVA